MNKEKETKKPTTKLNIYQKLQIVQAEIGKLKKAKQNTYQKYFYVDECTFLVALKPLLQQQQLTLTFDDTDDEIRSSETETKKGSKEWILQFRKRAILTNAEKPDEQIISKVWAMGQNTDIAKTKGSADTYAVKYFLQKFFLIATDDNDDPDAKDDGTDPKEKAEDKSTLKKEKLQDKKEFTPEAIVTITNIKEMLDKNKNKFLLLANDDLPNNVFVFDYKVEASRWPELIKGKTYQFNLEESNNDLLVLLDFKEIK